jgi:hypothetical protein
VCGAYVKIILIGVVAEVGTGVQDFKVGDEVYGLANGFAGKVGCRMILSLYLLLELYCYIANNILSWLRCRCCYGCACCYS